MALVVIAEDDDDIRTIMTRILRRAGHTVVEVADGAAALDAVRQHRPDVLFTDIDMPAMTGIQLCQAIRADPHLDGVPVVLVSGGLMPGDPRRDEAGATATLAKPFLPAALLETLNTTLTTGHQP